MIDQSKIKVKQDIFKLMKIKKLVFNKTLLKLEPVNIIKNNLNVLKND